MKHPSRLSRMHASIGAGAARSAGVCVLPLTAESLGDWLRLINVLRNLKKKKSKLNKGLWIKLLDRRLLQGIQFTHRSLKRLVFRAPA